MFERFTPTARRIVVLAHEEARQFRHGSIASDHLLLGILRLSEYVSDTDSRRAADALSALAVTLDGLREQIGPRHAQLSEGPVQIALSDDAKSALEETLRAALARKRTAIEATDVLLGLVRNPELGSAQVLQDLGVSAQTVRDELARPR
jgi:ATP-dependent Clp protease ATP-binding subunit ClpA